MTLRQRILRLIYPLVLWAGKRKGIARILRNREKKQPPVAFHSLEATLNGNKSLPFASLKGKKVLLVNTASNCGFTGQYAELQQLFEQQQGELVVIGFPANDFKEQEKGDDAAIASFCQLNYGVSFPLAAKASVVKGPSQHPVFRWLSEPELNGWNEVPPVWNFSKYLIDEEGVLTHVFEPSVSPLDPEVTAALKD
jgi:glutathione peroxidase